MACTFFHPQAGTRTCKVFDFFNTIYKAKTTKCSILSRNENERKRALASFFSWCVAIYIESRYILRIVTNIMKYSQNKSETSNIIFENRYILRIVTHVKTKVVYKAPWKKFSFFLFRKWLFKGIKTAEAPFYKCKLH